MAAAGISGHSNLLALQLINQFRYYAVQVADEGFGNHAFLFLKHCAAFLRESVFLETALRFIRDGRFDKTCFYRWFQIPFFKVCAPF